MFIKNFELKQLQFICHTLKMIDISINLSLTNIIPKFWPLLFSPFLGPNNTFVFQHLPIPFHAEQSSSRRVAP